MTDTVLVIGGTGQLGAPVARQLRGDGYRVRLPVERSQQLTTAMQARGRSRATWTTLTRSKTCKHDAPGDPPRAVVALGAQSCSSCVRLMA